MGVVLSVTILETTKTKGYEIGQGIEFYRSQFWRLQKPMLRSPSLMVCFIGHNFGDYKNRAKHSYHLLHVLSVTILETTKTLIEMSIAIAEFYRSQFWRLQKPQMVSANYTIRVRSYSA